MPSTLVQLSVTANTSKNILNARNLVLKAAQEGATVVVLPECFNSPYGTSYFPKYAEPIPTSQTCQALQSMARDAQIYLIGGSIPEIESGKYYNTCTVWNPKGDLIAKHRKVHLFDIDIPGKITFKESEILTPGNQLTHFETEFGKFGIGICYDIRFPEMAMMAARNGCHLMIYPGAFNMTTGPLHWEILQRARALDNQLFVAACSPARDESASYIAWGHSTIVQPNGQVLAKAGEKEEIVYADIDFALLNQFRESVPLNQQRRFDLYKNIAE